MPKTANKSYQLDLKLINLVKANPMLYDNSLAQYIDFNEREVVWHKIGDEMKRPASECKARWVNIRDINRRILRKTLRNPRGQKKMYKYYHELSFMRPFYKDVMLQNIEFPESKEIATNAAIDDKDDYPAANDISDDSDDEKPIKSEFKNVDISTNGKKKYLDEAEQCPADIAEPVYGLTDFDSAESVESFLLSIGATLKTFSPYHLNLAKSKIFAIVQEYELQQIVSKKAGPGGNES